MLTIGMFLGSLFLAAVFLFAFRGVLESPSLQRTNYRGARVPTGAGLVFAPVFLVAWALVQALYNWRIGRVITPSLQLGMNSMLMLVLGMCLVGFLDDVAGDRGTGGFSGHIRAALSGTVTTGALKAVLGFAVALAGAAPVAFFGTSRFRNELGNWFLAAAMIALAANLFNLVDLRPGRALKLFFPGMLLTLALTLRFWQLRPETSVVFSTVLRIEPEEAYLIPALCVIAAALVLFPGDLRERYMMGDAGSNVLGAAFGLGLVLGLSFWWRVGALGALLVLNLISEKYSYTEVIAGNRVLGWLDSLGRKGRDDDGANYM